jgi:hypothetical protein
MLLRSTATPPFIHKQASIARGAAKATTRKVEANRAESRQRLWSRFRLKRHRHQQV